MQDILNRITKDFSDWQNSGEIDGLNSFSETGKFYDRMCANATDYENLIDIQASISKDPSVLNLSINHSDIEVLESAARYIFDNCDTDYEATPWRPLVLLIAKIKAQN